jgi:hypothetical protein
VVLNFSANPIYLPEGGKARHLSVFEIRAAHRSRTISFFLSRSEVGVGVPAAGWMVGGSGRRGWEVGRPAVRASGFWVVEAAEPGGE